MKIINIKKCKKQIILFFSESEQLPILPGTFAEFNLYIDKDINEEELVCIKQFNRIETFCVLISKRLVLNSYSPKKVEEILIKKQANKSEIKLVLEKLTSLGLLNESKMIEDIIDKCDIKHYGFNRIIKMLRDRKISEKQISKVEYCLKREKAECISQLQVLLKRYSNRNSVQQQKAIFQGLIRCGFEEEVAKEAILKISTYNHNHEINVLKLDYKKYFLKYSRKYQGVMLNQKITNALLTKGYLISDINVVKEKNI